MDGSQHSDGHCQGRRGQVPHGGRQRSRLNGRLRDRLGEHEIAASLPHGLQRGLQIAIALAPGPKLLLLDEPVTGMNQVEVDEVIDLIRRLLKTRARRLAGSLSGGEQQLVAFARGLLARPKALLVDEPTVGVAPLLVQELGRTLREINRQGVAILLVEQNAAMALRLAQRGYVLETGRIVLSGKAGDLLLNDHVRKSYLGK
ncbi:MAG: ATP-binding cassette domain-containing protein [Candidatus Rokubacteria bacterium]|nr:ATP-binding cassette domain-containing protein [Candidatus Rokubacteria bacterium]